MKEDNVNELQIGGDHYKSEYQHWDFVLDANLPYLPAQISRYVSRWRKKAGKQDLEKALHYVKKLRMQEQEVHKSRMLCVAAFVAVNDLDSFEEEIHKILCEYMKGPDVLLLSIQQHIQYRLALLERQENESEAARIDDPEFRNNSDEWRKEKPATETNQ